MLQTLIDRAEGTEVLVTTNSMSPISYPAVSSKS